MKLLDHPTLTWGFKAEADPGTAGRAIPYPRGRVLGGSSSINGLIYIRGQPEDFDHWAQLGNRGWGWDDVLPYFKQAERWQGEAQRIARHRRLSDDLADGRAAGGLPGDHRGGAGARPRIPRRTSTICRPAPATSIGWCQQTRGGRRRASAAQTYLKPAAKRGPICRSSPTRWCTALTFDGNRATGIVLSRGGRVESVDAAREVILAAGAIGSPHLLQLSGVGGPEDLAKAGIPVHHALPGVGQNFQDHYIARMSCRGAAASRP